MIFRKANFKMLILDWKTTFIALAMIITGSSVRKLQAKAGLPLVNQVAGWVVLGE